MPAGTGSRSLFDPFIDAVRDGAFGGVTAADGLYLLLCLTFLRRHAPADWEAIRHRAATGDDYAAEALPRLALAAVDRIVARPGTASETSASRFRPRSMRVVRHTIEFSGRLRSADMAVLHEIHAAHAGTTAKAHHTPAGVARTIARILDAGGEAGAVYYDPFARGGELLGALLQEAADPRSMTVLAESPYAPDLRLAGMRLHTFGSPLRLTAGHPGYGPGHALRGAASIVVANPPFNSSIRYEPPPGSGLPFPPPRSGNYAWVWHCLDALAPGGRAVVVMPYAAGFSPTRQDREMRRAMIEAGTVTAVVALPPNLFTGTTVGVSLWVLRSPDPDPAKITFVDASELGEKNSGTRRLTPQDRALITGAVAGATCRLSVVADLDTIRAHDYSLSPGEYIGAEPTPEDSHWPRRRLGDLCDIQVGAWFESLRRARTGKGPVGVLYPRHLTRNLDTADAPTIAESWADGLNRYRLRAGDVVCVRTGAMCGPILVPARLDGWIASTNLFRVRIRDTAVIDARYLVHHLSRPETRQRIRQRSKRSVTTSMNTATFNDLEIPLPSLSEQQRIVSTATEEAR
ncbi:hypothetical protein MB27_37170 [Actinoplanes utahensis]|uniref:Uncharacterized protein n=2 Tax=Actinoplanes utahensis TaxID=1869 RepID=A0A0A6UBZ5_ACTUT|nr:hypothetical protein MB27_37170 [Actinoplanes utahensis]